jgi:hypothetical protein
VAVAGSARAAPLSLDLFPVFLQAHQNGDDTVAQFCYQGHLIVCPGGAQSFTIASVQGFSHQRATLLPDGRMKLALIEVGYYGNPETDEISDTLTNPFNGNTIRPHHYKSGPQENFAAADGVMEAPRISKIPGARFTGRLSAPLRSGDYVFFSEELNVLVPAAKEGAPARAMTSLANYSARFDDLKTRRGFVPLVFDYCSIGGFADWLDMGAETGVQVMRLSGRKLRPNEPPPASLAARIRADYPGFIENGGV